MNMAEKTKVLALVHLKSGKRPKEVSEILNISYSQALKLAKELTLAEKQDAVSTLFNLEEAAIQTLVDTVKSELQGLDTLVDNSSSELSTILDNVSAGAAGLANLEVEFQLAASELVKKIAFQTVACAEVTSILALAEALSRLQNAFFAKGTNVQINNLGSKYERYLSD